MVLILSFRNKVTNINKGAVENDNSMNDMESLDFYNLATGKLLTALEVGQ